MPPGVPRTRALAAMVSVVTVLLVLAAFGAISVLSPGTGTSGAATAVEAPGDGTTSLLAAGPATAPDEVAPNTATDVGSTGQQVGSMSQIRNVVLLLADDLDWALFNQVPRLKALTEEGTTLTNFVVTDSLCCPSRTSIMRSQYVHNHKVVSNIPQTGGGWATFQKRGLEKNCLPTWLQSAGVQTALVGKYLNGYPGKGPGTAQNPRKRTYIPPGWSHFVTSVSGNQSYRGYEYVLNDNGSLRRYRSGPSDFMNDVLTANATQWLGTTQEPFFLEFASYSPHIPAPVAERNRGSHAGSLAPRPPSFNAVGQNEPAWLAKVPAIAPGSMARLDSLWTRRAESAESIADSYDAIVAQLRATGHLDDTLIIVTSDNGYHVGTHRLPTGKQTAYREDSVVPAVLIGPGIEKGATINRMTSTIDLGPTIAELMGAPVPAYTDGRSLVPLLEEPTTAPWRTGVLIESLSKALPGDPDFTAFDAPIFHALRTQQWLYVEYDGGDVALYDLVTDPYEVDNVAPTTSATTLALLRSQLAALERCAGASCRVADSLAVPPSGPASQVTPSPTATPSASASATPTASPGE